MLRTTTVLIFAFLYFRWTEGLISAAKAVGLGAKLLVDAADKVVLGSGKFEEIMAASQVRAVFFMRNISLTDLFPHSVRLSVLYHIFFFSSTYIQIWYLNIYSQEISASTAQLVIASRVKAKEGSSSFDRLREASKVQTSAPINLIIPRD